MAEDNLKDFIVNWGLFGLLLTCLLSFTVIFMYENNPIGLNDGSETIIDTTNTNLTSKLYELEDDANDVLNITAGTNPEISQLGSRDSVASSYKITGSSKKMWGETKQLIGWVFSGDVGKIILSVFGSLFAFISIYLITKWIRIGG